MTNYDPRHDDIATVVLLDTQTRKTATVSRYSSYWWAEGNGACDCNRSLMFDGEDESPCGNTRYLIIWTNLIHYTLQELNGDYADSLLQEHLPESSIT